VPAVITSSQRRTEDAPVGWSASLPTTCEYLFPRNYKPKPATGLDTKSGNLAGGTGANSASWSPRSDPPAGRLLRVMSAAARRIMSEAAAGAHYLSARSQRI
jgi:hypothetical protein